MNLTANESLFCQAIATTSLLSELHRAGFLHSDYYNEKINFHGNSSNINKILLASGLGNPATMQMYLYTLLVMPKELLKADTVVISAWKNEINTLVSNLIFNVQTTYHNEDNNDKSTINFYRHIRNAVAHSKCEYTTIQNISYVTFKDIHMNNNNQHCEITLSTANAGLMIEKLLVQLMDYLNKKFSEK